VKTFALTLAAVLAASTAHADNALRPERIPNKARQLADKGKRLHESGDFTGAVTAFKEAYVLAPSPSLLFNIAQSYRLAGKCDESAWMYRRFLDTDPRGPQRDLAEQQLGVVEKCGSGGLRVTITPPAAPALPETGASAAVGSDLALTLTGGSQAHDDIDRRGARYKTAAKFTAVGGGVMLIGAALFAIDAHEASNSVEDTYRRGGKWDDVEPIDARGRRSETYATVLGIGGGVAMVSAAVLYGLGKHYESSPASHLAVGPTKHGAQVSLSWGF
jgi:hypothetical protein